MNPCKKNDFKFFQHVPESKFISKIASVNRKHRYYFFERQNEYVFIPDLRPKSVKV